MKKSLLPSRLSNRGSGNPEDIRRILKETLFCTVSYCKNNKPFAIPTGFCLLNDKLMIHGSAKSAFLKDIADADQVCISAFLFDGLVLATSAFHHSVNYRSVVIFAKPEIVHSATEKEAMLKVFTDRYVPERWPDLKPVTPGEIKATSVLAFNIDYASAKIRQGPPSFDPNDKDLNIWTGVIPSVQSWGKPVPDPNRPGFSLPDHLKNFY